MLKDAENSIEKLKRIDIIVGVECGCLRVLDDGSEYLQVMDTRISDIKEEKEDFVKAVKEGRIARKDWHGWNGKETIVTPAYDYKPINFEVCSNTVRVCDFDEEILGLLKEKEIKHYKCICKKCGKIRYYSDETLQTQPKVCYKPMYCSSRQTYSIKAQNATYRKKKKYENNESVHLVDSKDDIIPAEVYCDSWNEKRKKELLKQAEKDAKIIAEIPRKRAKNYDKNFVGLKYESYEVLECVNEALESVPTPYYNQRHQKKYRDIIVYKEYRCKCYLCGKEW